MHIPRQIRQKGFTLIELLVVIAIIAILAAIILPVLAAAKQKAYTTLCINNQHQLALATILYTGDYRECYPFGVNVIADAQILDPSAWDVLILPYAGLTTNGAGKVFACPAETAPILPSITFPYKQYPFQFDYCANEHIFHKIDNNATPRMTALPTSKIRVPSQMLMISEKQWDSPEYHRDAANWDGWLKGWNATGFGTGKNASSSGLLRHKLLPVLACVDGHVGRWRVPPWNPGAASPISWPDLGDTRIDTSPYWKSPAPDYWLRDLNTEAGF